MSIRQYLRDTFLPQEEESDNNDFQDEFEPDDPKTLPHLYTVSDVQIEAVMREAKNCDGVFASGMFKALELLGLPS